MKIYKNYIRIMPRDLFNDSGILRDYGKLWIELDKRRLSHLMKHEEPEDSFIILQNESSGGTIIGNVKIYKPLIFVRPLLPGGNELIEKKDMIEIELERPLNSRKKNDLYFEFNDEVYSVFNDEGSLTDHFMEAIKLEYIYDY